MARKPTLSPTKITTFLSCPVKYRWTYLDPIGKRFMRAKSYYSFGSSLHAVLQRFHDPEDQEVVSLDSALAALGNQWVAAGYATPQQEAEAFESGKTILEAYVERHAAAEVVETVAVEKMLRADMGDFVLMGRVDRIDRLSDGTLVIVDYKSGRDSVSEEEVREDLAMCCYQLLVRRNYPGSAVAASIVALRSGDQATASLNDEEVLRFESDLRQLALMMLTADFDEMTPKLLKICPRCDFLPLCRMHADFRAEEEAAASTATVVTGD